MTIKSSISSIITTMEHKRLSIIFLIYTILCLFFAIYFIFYFDKKYLKLIQKNGDSSFSIPISKQLKSNTQEIKDSIQKLRENIVEGKAADCNDSESVERYVSEFSHDIEAKLEANESIVASKISLDLHKTVSDESKAIISALENSDKNIQQELGKLMNLKAFSNEIAELENKLSRLIEKTACDESKALEQRFNDALTTILDKKDGTVEATIVAALENSDKKIQGLIDKNGEQLEQCATATQNIGTHLGLVSKRVVTATEKTEQQLAKLETAIEAVSSTQDTNGEKLSTKVDAVGAALKGEFKKLSIDKIQSILDEKINSIGDKLNCESVHAIEENMEKLPQKLTKSLGIGAIDKKLIDMRSSADEDTSSILDKLTNIETSLETVRSKFHSVGGRIEESVLSSIPSKITNSTNEIQDKMDKQLIALKKQIDEAQSKIEENCNADRIKTSINSAMTDGVNSSLIIDEINKSISAATAISQTKLIEDSANSIGQKIVSVLEKKNLQKNVDEKSQQQQHTAPTLTQLEKNSEKLLEKISQQLANDTQQNELLNSVNGRLIELKRAQDNNLTQNEYRRDGLNTASRLEQVYGETQKIAAKLDASGSGDANAEFMQRIGRLEEMIQSTSTSFSKASDESSKNIIDYLKKQFKSNEGSHVDLGKKLDQLEQVCLAEMRENAAKIKQRLDEPSIGNDILTNNKSSDDKDETVTLLKKLDTRTLDYKKSLNTIMQSIDHIPTCETIRPTVEKIESMFNNNSKIEERLVGVVHGNERIEKFLATDALGKLGKISQGTVVAGARKRQTDASLSPPHSNKKLAKTAAAKEEAIDDDTKVE